MKDIDQDIFQNLKSLNKCKNIKKNKSKILKCGATKKNKILEWEWEWKY